MNISPETIAGSFAAATIDEYVNKTAPRPSDEYSCSPNGWMYRKDIHGIIPIEIKKVFDQRKQYKNMMLACDRNAELCKAILHDENHAYGVTITYSVDVRHDFDDAFKSMLSGLSKDAMEKLLEECKDESILCNTNQLSRKVLINSLYGSLGNNKFRYYDLRNASAITLFGQLAIMWIERKVNEYLNGLCETTDYSYVRYCDTDSVVGDTLIDVNGEKMTIADFFDSMPENYMRKDDDNLDYVKAVEGVTSLSVNTESKEVERKSVKYVMKHRVKKRMFKITANGRSVTVTEDHSVMVLRDGEIIAVKPLDMRKGDKVLSL